MSPKLEAPTLEGKSVGNGIQASSKPRAGRPKANKFSSPSSEPELSVALSASLRAELLREIDDLGAADDTALWAQRRLPVKNQLSATDAQQVEEAFAGKLAVIQAQNVVFPEPRRVRDRDHIRQVIKQPCLVCGRRPSDPHHLRLAQSRALGRKVSDEFTVPLCRPHHREVHRCGNEGSWWQKTGIEPLAVARALWLETHPLRQWEPPVANNEGS